MTLSVLLVMLWATSVAATVMRYVDLARLVELSDVIVQGRVLAQTTTLDDETKQPWTTTKIEVGHAFLSEPGSTVEFLQWGGEHDGSISAIPGDATFQVGEEVIIFLVDGKGEFAGNRYLAALTQSKFSVTRDTGKAMVARDLREVAILDPDTKKISAGDSEPRPLENFIPELQSLIAGIKGGSR